METLLGFDTMHRSVIHQRRHPHYYDEETENLPLHSDYNQKRRKNTGEESNSQSRLIPGVCLLLIVGLLRSPTRVVVKHWHPQSVRFDYDNVDVLSPPSLIARRRTVYSSSEKRHEKRLQAVRYDIENESEDADSDDSTDNESNSSFTDSEEDDTGGPDRYESECESEWQSLTQNLGACNPVHEIDMMPSEDIFIFAHADGQKDVFILSDPKSTSMGISTGEALISSPKEVNIVASCGTAQVMEYSRAGKAHTFMSFLRWTCT